MADDATTMGIAAAMSAVVLALKEIGAGLMKLVRRKAADDKAARAEAKEEDGERDQWQALNSLRDQLAKHEKDDAKAFGELNTKIDRTHEDVREMKSDIKALLRRPTGDVPKGR